MDVALVQAAQDRGCHSLLKTECMLRSLLKKGVAGDSLHMFLMKHHFSRRVFMLLLLKTGDFRSCHSLLKTEYMLHSR